jgi:hypothetical protein
MTSTNLPKGKAMPDDPTIHDLKIQDAQDHIREELKHVGGDFATRAEVLTSAWKTLSASGLDSAQQAEAFMPWGSEMKGEDD